MNEERKSDSSKLNYPPNPTSGNDFTTIAVPTLTLKDADSELEWLNDMR